MIGFFSKSGSSLLPVAEYLESFREFPPRAKAAAMMATNGTPGMNLNPLRRFVVAQIDAGQPRPLELL